jgi:hypothetical protein
MRHFIMSSENVYYNSQKTKYIFLFNSLSKTMVTSPLACYATAIVQRACFAHDISRYVVTSRKELFKRLYSVNDLIKCIGVWIYLFIFFS